VILKSIQVLSELLIFVAGGYCLFQKIADMKVYHQLRVVVLTTLLSVIMILLYDKCFSLAML